MAFPAAPILDTAIRANEGPPPSSAWVSKVDSDDAGMKIVSNKIAPDTGTGTASALWYQSFPANQEVFVQVDALMEAGPDSFEMFLNVQSGGTATPSGYIFRFWSQSGAGVGRLEMDRMDSGAFTRLIDVAQTIVVGDVLGARNDNGTLRFYVNGVEKTNATDTTYGAGQIGLGTRLDDKLASRFSNFGGGVVVAKPLLDFQRKTSFPFMPMRYAPGQQKPPPLGTDISAQDWHESGPKPYGGYERFLFNRLGPVFAGTIFDQALTADTVLATASLQKQVGVNRSATSVVVTGSVAKQAVKTFTATAVGVTASLTKSIARALTATAVAVTATRALSAGKKLTATAVGVTASLVRAPGKVLSATVVVTATRVRQVAKSLTATSVVVTANLVVIRVFLKALTATVAVTGSLVKSAGKPLSATVALSATLVRSVGKTLSKTVVVTASLTAVRAFLKSLTATVVVTGTMLRSVGKPLSATVAVSASIARQVARTFSATVAATGSLVRQVGKRLSATSLVTAALTRALAYGKVLSATVNVTATLTRRTGKLLSASASVTGTVAKQVGKRLSASVSVLADLLTDQIVASLTRILRFGSGTPSGGTGSGTPDADGFGAGNPAGGSTGTPSANQYRPGSPGRERT